MARISNLDFYAILGVHPNAEDIVIRAAFKALAQRYHPDRFKGSQDEAHRRMADLTNAYETLADPARRRKYDRRRGLTPRRATFYFKNPARERQPPFGALATRAAARKARHYRTAVYVLMVVVVILSGFNVHQHSAQIKELLAWNGPASRPINVATPGVAGNAPAPASGKAVPSSAPPASSTANVRILPIGQGSTRLIGSNALEPPAASPSAPDPVVATPPPAPPNGTKAPARPAAVEPRKAPVAATTAAPAADAARKAAKASTPKPVVDKAVEPERSAAPPSASTEADRCGDAVAALGLCNRSPTPQEQ
jgi:hypothetical protein